MLKSVKILLLAIYLIQINFRYKTIISVLIQMEIADISANILARNANYLKICLSLVIFATAAVLSVMLLLERLWF